MTKERRSEVRLSGTVALTYEQSATIWSLGSHMDIFYMMKDMAELHYEVISRKKESELTETHVAMSLLNIVWLSAL